MLKERWQMFYTIMKLKKYKSNNLWEIWNKHINNNVAFYLLLIN